MSDSVAEQERMTMPNFTEEYRTDDKAEWGDGPWMAEPDKAVWVDEATGLDCLIVRNRSGSLCGYVGLPPGHPSHGKGYDDVDADVHGGLTFAGGCQLDDGDQTDHSTGICHIPQTGRPDAVWWLGFDTAHWMDFSPGMAAREKSYMPEHLQSRPGPESVYRDLGYVVSEVENLARQLVR